MKVTTLQKNDTLEGLAAIRWDITFSERDGLPLKCALLLPWNGPACWPDQPAGRFPKSDARYPAVVFIQGSGWGFPEIRSEIPQLSQLARAGYIVMTITHRSTGDGHRVPEFLRDAKCAVRWLRAHAGELCLDPSRIGAFGTSSGGNTAMLLAMTGDDPRYATEEYAGFSDAVSCAAECFGPTDLIWLAHTLEDPPAFIRRLTGSEDNEEALREISPLLLLEKGKAYPPMLLLHGDADPVVPFNQAEAFGIALEACGGETELIRVAGAPHERSFWSRTVFDLVQAFFDAHL